MKAILIPVKIFAESKKRLAPYYSAADRAALAGALCEDFFAIVAQVRGIDRMFVVSQEPRALKAAEKNGWETITETEQISESHSVDAASRLCAARGIQNLLRLPIDLPLAEPRDIEAIFAEHREPPSAVLMPSRDGTGTNALLRAPPTLFPSHFGPNSFVLHLEAAEKSGAQVKILRNPRMELDIDEIEDLRALAGRLDADCATARWLAHHRV